MISNPSRYTLVVFIGHGQRVQKPIHDGVGSYKHLALKNGDVLMHRLYGAIDIDGTVYRVKTTVKESLNDFSKKAYTYEVTNIELLDGHTGPSVSGTTPRKSNNSISATILLKEVEKSYDPKKKVLDAEYLAAVTEGIPTVRVDRATPDTTTS